MKILINDLMQHTESVPDAIKSPALSDTYTAATSFIATFTDVVTVNCIGIGYTDATEVTISDGETSNTISITQDSPYMNGLYLLDDSMSYEYEYGSQFTISHNGSYIGRLAIGQYRTLGTNPTKEIGFFTTNSSRKTMSGQVIPGAGGYSGRRASMDVRYKIDDDIYDDIEQAYESQIMRGFPYFILFDDEAHKLPANMRRFYGYTSKPLSMLQSSSYRFLYSYKFDFYEGF